MIWSNCKHLTLWQNGCPSTSADYIIFNIVIHWHFAWPLSFVDILHPLTLMSINISRCKMSTFIFFIISCLTMFGICDIFQIFSRCLFIWKIENVTVIFFFLSEWSYCSRILNIDIESIIKYKVTVHSIRSEFLFYIFFSLLYDEMSIGAQ